MRVQKEGNWLEKPGKGDAEFNMGDKPAKD